MDLMITNLDFRVRDLGLDEFFEELHKQKTEYWYWIR